MNKIAKQLYEQGYIDKEAAQRLDEFDGLLKEAGVLDSIKNTLFQTAKNVGPHALATTLGIFGAQYLTNKSEKKRKEDELAELRASFGTMRTKDPDIASKTEKAERRFNEIAHFSPTFAKMPDLARPLIKRTIDTGLSEKDVRNLVQIEAGKRQVDSASVREPSSATFLREVIAPAIQSAGEQGIQIAESPAWKASREMRNLTNKSIYPVLLMLQRRGALPPELAAADLSTSKGRKLVKKLEKENPYFMVQAAAEHGLKDEWNRIIEGAPDFTKEGSYNSSDLVGSIPVEKRAEILADQCLLTKHAFIGRLGPKVSKFLSSKQNALMGLGAATLFGASGALLEEGVDYARTKELNEKIDTSWKETQQRLKKLSEEGVGSTAGIDYSERENLRKAEDAFKVLTDVAPTLASNPAVATPFVNRTVQQEGDIHADTIKVLSEAQRNINTSREYKSPFADSSLAQGFGTGFQAGGGKEFIKSVAKVD